jgi:hypothetical protein
MKGFAFAVRFSATGWLLMLLCQFNSAVGQTPDKLLWGDTHLHTAYSFDAFLNNNLTADPDTAYRFAQGQPVIHPYHRARVQLQTPLDFLVVSDHAEFMGGLRDIYYNGLNPEDAGIIDRIMNWYRTRTVRNAIDAGEGSVLFRSVLPESAEPSEAAKAFAERAASRLPTDPRVIRNAWQAIAASADAHYQPGRFTSFIGWEWSSLPGGANLHRVVVSDANAQQASTFVPYASTDSPYPDDLWRWLDATSAATGADFIAIPHNSNLSKGMMFAAETLRGAPIDRDYAQTRMRWEPIVEATQIKGDSEVHPLFAPNDEFADFEQYPFYIQQQPEPYQPKPGDYVRSGLKTGLAIGSEIGANPYEFGLIGSTDGHTGLASAEENNFWGKMATDSTPETKINTLIAGGSRGWTMSASGLAAVWATENTRQSIMAAFRRRETYATTGPRIQVRVFGGWTFSHQDLQAEDLSELGYARGVPMGGELQSAASGQRPAFMITALKDPKGANLDRVQVIKGWLDAAGNTQERVIDAVWSGNRQPNDEGKLPQVGNSVDLKTGQVSNGIGAAELRGVWRDEDFDASQAAFYYVRVLEIPTARHAHYDALALGMEAPTVGPTLIQERAYTSPIWYKP